MKYSYLLSVLFAVLLFNPLHAQQTPLNWCGTKGKSAWLSAYQKNKTHNADNVVDTTWLYVPVTVHSVGTDAGGGHYNMDNILRALCQMNEKYKPAYIKFYMLPEDPIRYINNSTWYEHDWNGGSDMIQSNKIPGRLNIFVVSDPAGNCGYSWQDAIVLGKNCSGSGNSTWAHEAGHHLSLPHPFYGWEGETLDLNNPAPNSIHGVKVERTDGSNCYNASDGFCDTKPDYLNYRWACNGDYESTVVQKDPDGVDFRSDATLIMGYSLDQCSNRFTPEQIEAMRDNLRTEHADYLQISSFPEGISDAGVKSLISPIDSSTVEYNDATFKWNAVPGALFYSIEVGLNENFVPRVLFKSVQDTFLHNLSNLPKNRLMYWRVRAYSGFDLCNPNNDMQIGAFYTRDLSATNELESSVSVDLSPNPVFSGATANLMVVSDRKLSMQLSIFDVSGKLIQNREVVLYEGDNNLEINTENLNAGVYFIAMRNEKGEILKKLVVVE